MGRSLNGAIKVCVALVAFLWACGDTAQQDSSPPAESLGAMGTPLGYNRLSLKGHLPAPKNIAYEVAAENGPPGISAADFRSVIAEAAKVWNRSDFIRWVELEASAPAGDRVVFSWHQADSGCTADLECRSACAHAGPVNNQSFVHFDPSREWSLRGENAEFGLLQAALHEMGHIMGLGHVDDKTSLMYPSYSKLRLQPNAADLAGLAVLYDGLPQSAEPGDLLLQAKGQDFLRLPRVIRRGETLWRIFDSNADGRDEILIFEKTRGGLPRFSSFHFDDKGAFSHTRGPIVLPFEFVEGCVLSYSQDGHALVLVPRAEAKSYAIYRFSKYGSVAGVWPKGLKLTTSEGWVDEDGDGNFEVWTPAKAFGDLRRANLSGHGLHETVREVRE